MRIVCQLPTDDWARVRRRAAWAEAAGYDGVTTSELAHDPFMPLAIASQATEQVALGTSIAVAFPRSPMIAANLGFDLNAQSGGRFELGLGSQVKGHNERRFSTPWTAPVPRLREYVEAIRAIWRCWEYGEKLKYEGEHYQITLMTPEWSPKKAGFAPPPISLAAVGPHMLKMAGRVADGVRLHGFCTRKYIENVCMPKVEEGMALSGRKREALEVSGGGFIATGPDAAAVQEKLDWVRYRVGFYGSTRTYLPVFEQHGLEELGLKLHKLSVEGKWSELASHVSDDVVRLFAAVGDYDDLPRAAAERYGGVVDTLRLDLPDDIDPDQHKDLIARLKAIPSRFEAFQTAA
mgnify:CR=1 FL=1